MTPFSARPLAIRFRCSKIASMEPWAVNRYSSSSLADGLANSVRRSSYQGIAAMLLTNFPVYQNSRVLLRASAASTRCKLPSLKPFIWNPGTQPMEMVCHWRPPNARTSDGSEDAAGDSTKFVSSLMKWQHTKIMDETVHDLLVLRSVYIVQTHVLTCVNMITRTL